MRTKHLLRTALIISVLISTLSCDQFSKSMVRRNMDYNQKVEIISNYFTLMKIENAGAFLSLGDSLSSPLKFIFLTMLPSLILAFGLVFLLVKTDLTKTTVVGLAFVIGGGIGNIYDRIVYGSVTDFLHIDFGIFQTGVFNMADVSIMTGVFLILIHSYFNKPALKEGELN